MNFSYILFLFWTRSLGQHEMFSRRAPTGEAFERTCFSPLRCILVLLLDHPLISITGVFFVVLIAIPVFHIISAGIYRFLLLIKTDEFSRNAIEIPLARNNIGRYRGVSSSVLTVNKFQVYHYQLESSYYNCKCSSCAAPRTT